MPDDATYNQPESLPTMQPQSSVAMHPDFGCASLLLQIQDHSTEMSAPMGDRSDIAALLPCAPGNVRERRYADG